VKEKRRSDTVLRYDVDALKRNRNVIDQNIARIQGETVKARTRIDAARNTISRLEKDIEIFQSEIARLKRERDEIDRLIARGGKP